uniref:Epimerase domain-containing protein n=1 Tax=Panagrellus redivivus TaxID=6233 RepID=A0A7E4W9I4_PANRE
MSSTLVIGEASPLTTALAEKLNAAVLLDVLPTSNAAWLTVPRERVFFGSASNEQLVTRVLDTQKIETVVYVPYESTEKKESVVESARRHLITLTHFLDGWRKAENAADKTLVFLSALDVYGPVEGGILPPAEATLKPNTPIGAGLAGAEAMLHSYAVSYRLNIKILRLNSAQPPSTLENVTTAITLLPAHKTGPAEIFNLPTGTSNDLTNEYTSKLTNLAGWTSSNGGDSTWLQTRTSKPFTPLARFLIYGAKGWIGEQFVALLQSRGLEAVAATTRPGTDRDEVIAAEIASVAPSHIVSMLGRTHGPGIGNIDYLEGGPDKLTENVRDNLYAPWSLANLAEKFGLHFTYLGTGCLFEYDEEHQRDGKAAYNEDSLPNFKGNKYSAIKGFTDLTLRSFKHTLNARIRLPINDEDSPRNLLRKLIGFSKVQDIPNSVTYLPNLLPILVDLALEKTSGALNLVNPGAITFPEILKIYETETGKKLTYEAVEVGPDSPAVKTRAHCTLDTTRLEALAPSVLPIKEALKQAVHRLAV